MTCEVNGRDGNEVGTEEPTEILDPAEAEEWPVTELYRVPAEPAEPIEPAGDPTVVAAAAPPAHTRRPVLRRLPAGGAGLAGAIALATLGIALGAWLLARDASEADAGGATTPAAQQTTVDTPPASAPPSASPAEVPEVVGLRVSNARALLEGSGFEVRVTRQSSPRPPGEVLEQEPAAGRKAQPGETVTLTVARPAMPVVLRVEVPDVVSLPVADASAELRRAALRAQVELVASNRSAGTVVEQDPPAGSEVREGSLVVLSVARSKAPEVVRVDVPDVVGSTLSDARRTLRAREFRISVVRVPDDAPAGTVVAQSPSGGTSARQGATVRLRVSTGPKTVSVPDVLGLDESTARAELEAAGFTVRVSEEPTDDPANDGVVLRQSPAGGSTVEVGGVVTIFVGRFD